MARTRRTRSVVAAAAALVALSTVSACSNHPGYAAVVGADSISPTQVDDVAHALCPVLMRNAQTGAAQPVADRTARGAALGNLISSSLSKQYGASKGVQADQTALASAVNQVATTAKQLPADRRATFTQTGRDYFEGYLILGAIGQDALVKAGQKNVAQSAAVAAGTKLRDAWVSKHLTVTVDPRYGSYAKGALVPSSGSLSVAASSRSKAGAQVTSPPTWIDGLPANQKCS